MNNSTRLITKGLIQNQLKAGAFLPKGTRELGSSTPEHSGEHKSLASMQTHQLYMLRFGNWLLRIVVEILWAFIQHTQTDLSCLEPDGTIL